MRITPLGDRALRIEVGDGIEEAAVRRVQALTARLEAARLPGIVELVPAYTTIATYYDPALGRGAGIPPERYVAWLTAQMTAALAEPDSRPDAQGRTVEIPVCYGGAFGPDLAAVAARAGLAEREAARRHAAAPYLVALLGFAPGFPYLLGLPTELATPRLASPRVRVPDGSVAIAGAQTGIYPLATPGGWNLIGRTPLRLFDAGARPPTLLQPGDRVLFRAIDPDTFAAAEAQAAEAGQR